MKYKIFKKLDRRSTGHKEWQYYVNRPNRVSLYDATQQFYVWREWCWSTWGSSKELHNWVYDREFVRSYSAGISTSDNDHWCWLHDQYSSRIYLRTDKELSQFLLKWC